MRGMKLISMFKKDNTKPIRRTVTDWLKVLVLLLDDAAALLVVILVIQFFKIRIPLPVAIVVGLLLGTFVFMLHRAIIPSFHRRIVTGSEGMIGGQGRVVEPLTPVGAVTISGERWKAKSVGEDIEVDEDVEIVGLDGLTLRVKHKEQ